MAYYFDEKVDVWWLVGDVFDYPSHQTSRPFYSLSFLPSPIFVHPQGHLVLCLEQLSDGSVRGPPFQQRSDSRSMCLQSNGPRSSCYKEATFENHHLDVWTGTQWMFVVLYRFFVVWKQIDWRGFCFWSFFSKDSLPVFKDSFCQSWWIDQMKWLCCLWYLCKGIWRNGFPFGNS